MEVKILTHTHTYIQNKNKVKLVSRPSEYKVYSVDSDLNTLGIFRFYDNTKYIFNTSPLYKHRRVWKWYPKVINIKFYEI